MRIHLLYKLKTIHIIGALVIGIFLLFILSKNKKQSTPQLNPRSLPSSVPLPSGITNANPNLEIINTPPANLGAQTSDHLTIAPIPPSNYANQLAQSFNFQPPQITEFPDNTTKYSFQNDTITLDYYPEDDRINYFNSAIYNNFTSLPDSLINQAENFIYQHFQFPQNVTISQINALYLKSNETVAHPVPSSSQANLIQYEFRYFLSGSPIYQPPYAFSDITIILNNEGVRSLTLKPLPQIIPTTQQDNLITPEQMQIKLNQKQFTIIKINKQQYTEGGPLLNISQMKADSVTLGYILTNDSINPYYIIAGTAPDSQNPQTTYQVEIAISATNP